MGQFSWFTQDDHSQIVDDKKETVYMVDPRDGTTYKEECYDGYGHFGGRDFYELLADINKDTILLAYKDTMDDNDIIVMNKKFEDLSEDDTDDKRHYGIQLWYDYIKPESYTNRPIKKLPITIRFVSPILVRYPENWERYINTFPEDDPNQGWECNDDYEEDYDE